MGVRWGAACGCTGRSSAGLRRGAAAWGRAGARQLGAAQGCSGAGLRRAAVWGGAVVGGLCGGAAWGCAGAQQRGAAQSSCVGRRSGGGAV